MAAPKADISRHLMARAGIRYGDPDDPCGLEGYTIPNPRGVGTNTPAQTHAMGVGLYWHAICTGSFRS